MDLAHVMSLPHHTPGLVLGAVTDAPALSPRAILSSLTQPPSPASSSSLESEASRQLASTQDELGQLEIAKAQTEEALQSKNTPIQRVDEWLARRAERPQSEAIRDSVEMAIDALSKAIRESVRSAHGCVGV
jgi:hypothetical protein